MKYVEIEKLFTETVAKFLADGWTFHTASMTGHQGEIAKVDFQKNGDVIRVLLRKDRDPLVRSYMEIEVRRHAGKAERLLSWDTIWNDDGEVLEQRKFYIVAEDWFVGAEDEFGKIRRKRNERHDASKIFGWKLGERCTRIAWRWVKKNRKKSARLSDIVGVYRKAGDRNGILVVTKKGDYEIKAA